MTHEMLQELTQTNKLFEKLTFQINAFQEGFEILSSAKTLEDLGKNFCHILRGSLMTTHVNLYFRPNGSNEYTVVYEQRKNERPDLAVFLAEKSFKYFFSDEDNPMLVFIPRKDGSSFVLQVGPGMQRHKFSDQELMSVQLFIQLLDNACTTLFLRHAEKDLIFSLNNRLLQMNNLIDTGIELSKVNEESDLLSLVLSRAVSITNASYGRLTIKEGRKLSGRLYFPDSAKRQFAKKNLSDDLKLEENFRFSHRHYCLELREKESRTGIVTFDDTDKLLINALMRQGHAAIENDFLQRQSVEMEKVKRDLAIAATIQQRILPESLPHLEGFDVAGVNIPAIEVCGDYYDCLPISENKYALIMADVSGKGIPAALLVSSLQASIRVYLESDRVLTALVEKLNKLIYRSTTAEKYLTMCICFLDIESGEVQALNAGHNPPLICRIDRTLEKIRTGGIPVGMADLDLPYKMQTFNLARGESILFFTDGITEAMDSEEEMYEDHRLESFFLANREKPARQFVDELIKDLNSFVGDAEQSDDITVFYIRRNP